jgi:chromosome segregation ATPase
VQIDDLAETELRIKEQEELVSSLKNTSNVAERITQWQSRMATLQLENLRLSRELEYTKKEKITSEKSLEDYIHRSANLEEQMVELQIETDQRQVEWERRQYELENLLQQYEDERAQIFKAASTSDVSFNTLHIHDIIMLSNHVRLSLLFLTALHPSVIN